MQFNNDDPWHQTIKDYLCNRNIQRWLCVICQLSAGHFGREPVGGNRWVGPAVKPPLAARKITLAKKRY